MSFLGYLTLKYFQDAFSLASRVSKLIFHPFLKLVQTPSSSNLILTSQFRDYKIMCKNSMKLGTMPSSQVERLLGWLTIWEEKLEKWTLKLLRPKISCFILGLVEKLVLMGTDTAQMQPTTQKRYWSSLFPRISTPTGRLPQLLWANTVHSLCTKIMDRRTMCLRNHRNWPR